MYVKHHGSGPRTFLAFHGWGGDHREFLPLASRMPDDAHLLSVDLPGYGKSPEPVRWDMDVITDEIVELMEQNRLQDVTLIGFCSGAVMAMFAALRRPELVSRIVMIEPFAFLPWYFRIFLAGEIGRRAYMTAFASSAGRKITTSILKRRQSTKEDFMGAFARVDHEITLRWLGLLHDVGGVKRFAGLSMPIDLAYGDQTFRAVQESVKEYCVMWPRAKTYELRNTGHLPLVRGARQLAGIIFGG